MIRRAIAGAALCSAFSAFAAIHVSNDAGFASASRPTGDHVATGAGHSYGSAADDPTAPASGLPQPGTLAMIGAGLLGLIGVGLRRRRDF